jgi:hypothetical protein
MSVVTQLYFQFFEENNYMFRPFSGWTISPLIFTGIEPHNGDDATKAEEPPPPPTEIPRF